MEIHHDLSRRLGAGRRMEGCQHDRALLGHRQHQGPGCALIHAPVRNSAGNARTDDTSWRDAVSCGRSSGRNDTIEATVFA